MTNKIRISKYKAILIAVILLLALCGYAIAREEAPSVSVSADKNSVTIGDHIIYSIIIRVPKGLDIGIPSFNETKKVGIFEVKNTGIESKKSIFGGKVVKSWYDLVPYQTGKTQIPALEVKYKKSTGKEANAIQTQPIKIMVQSVLPRNTAISDIKDIKGPLSYFEINWLLVLILTGFFVAIALFVYFKKRMARGPVKLPHETALEELEAIRASLLQAGDVKDFYVRISDCIRHYIERALSVKASEMTTEEFLNSMKTSPALVMEQKDLLKIFLSSCDLVKFAKYNPSAAEIEMVFTSAHKFVEETSPKKEI